MNIIAFDTETTGLSPRSGARIIEIGAVKISQGEIVDEFHSLVATNASISPHAQAVHGISKAMLRGQPKPGEVFSKFYEFIDQAVLVAHNAPFDTRFLAVEFERLKLPLLNKIECTLRLSRRKLPHLPNHKLETVYKHFGGVVGRNIRRHRALDDAKLLAFVWLKLEK